jgi:RND family efflux transporter MFP subunit
MRQLFIALTGLLLVACSSEPSKTRSSESKGIPVRTIQLEHRAFADYIQVTGTVQANKKIDILAEEGGILLTIKKDRGAFVRRGDTLAVLENKVLEAANQEAQAALKLAELELNSKQVLIDKKAISENEYLAAKYAVERSRANLNLTQARLEKLTIVAPFTGHIERRYFDPGAYVTPMSPIYQFVEKSRVNVTAGVAERFLKDIRVGSPVTIRFDAFPDVKLEERISFVYGTVDPESRTFQIEIQIVNPKGQLAPDMMADLKIQRRTFRDKIVIPMDAIVQSEEGRFAFTVDQNQAKRHSIEIIAVHDDSVLIDGLHVGDQLIVTGQQDLSDNDRVTPVSSPSLAAGEIPQ